MSENPEINARADTNLMPDLAVGDTLTALPTLNYALTPQQKIDISKLSSEQMARVQQIAASVSFNDTNTLLTYGADPQRKLNSYLDQLMAGLRACDVGAAGDLTIELATSIKAIHLSKMKMEIDGKDWVAATFGRIPLIGKYFSALRYFQLSHKQITDHLDAIEARANADITKLGVYNSKLDTMVDASIENLHDLDLYLAAAQIIIVKARADFEKKRAEVQISHDPIEIGRLHDFGEQINAFETRVVRMHLAYADSMISIPQIRASQEASRIAVSDIMDTILFDLPHLKRAILQVAALEATSRAAKANEARRDLTRQISAIGADELQDVYLKAKATQGGSEQDVAMLAQVADKLLQTIEAGRKLDEQNAQKRAKAIEDVNGIKQKFTEGMMASAAKAVAGTNA